MNRFEIFQSEKSGEYYFRLKASNGQIILGSEGYKARQSAKDAIESIIVLAKDERNFIRKETKDGRYYFVLKAKNNKIIGTSEIYSSRAGLELGIRSVMRNAILDSPIEAE